MSDLEMSLGKLFRAFEPATSSIWYVVGSGVSIEIHLIVDLYFLFPQFILHFMEVIQ
jgi:hypothetical protein